jgi:hypothetical protein
MLSCTPAERTTAAAKQDAPSSLPVIATAPSLTIAIPDSIGGASADMGNVVRLATGAIAIADWDGHRVLVFDSAGLLRRVVGRDGSGPGEFRAPMLLQAFGGDSLLIWDVYLKRLSWLDAGSGSGPSISLASAGLMGGNPVIGLLDDGRVVARKEQVIQPSSGKPPGRLASLLVLDARGNRVGTVAESLAYTTGDAHGYRFFQPTLQTATDGERILAGVSTEWRIATYAPDGQHVGDLVRPWKPRPVTDIDKAGIRASLTRSDMAPGFLDEDRFDATVPAFGRILPAADGSIWVLAYAAPYQAPDSVSIFSHEGQFLGAFALPPQFRPTEVGQDYVIGTATGEDGDLEIRAYSLLR